MLTGGKSSFGESVKKFSKLVFKPLRSAVDYGTGRLPAETMLQGHYIIDKRIGSGNMGSVYLAVDIQMGNRKVAVKEMSQSRLKPTELTASIVRFEYEATLLHKLSHPNLPKVHYWFGERNRFYLVMEFIDGENLSNLLASGGRRPLNVLQTLDYALQLCDVLAYLHRQLEPIVFRDLKPSNVMITPQGKVFLIDFGIARAFKPGQTVDTEPFITQGYAAPEQYGKAQTTPKADIYSLGATLHTCLTRRNPADSPSVFSFSSVCQDNPEVPIELDNLIHQMLATEVDKRPTDVLEVKRQLEVIRQQVLVNMARAGQNAAAYLPTVPVNQPVNPTPAAYLPTVPGAPYVPPGPFPQPVPSKPSLLAKIYSQLVGATQGIDKRLQAAWDTRSAMIWTPSFLAIFLLLFGATIAGSVYLLHIPQGSYALVGFCLALSLLLVSIIANVSVGARNALSQRILTSTSLTMLVACIALQALPSVHSVLQNITLSQLLSGGIVVAAILSLVRPTKDLAWVDAVALAAIAGSCALLQYAFGGQAEFQVFSFLTPESYAPTNTVLIWILVGAGGLTLLLRLWFTEFTPFDRFLVLLVTIIFALQQYAFGSEEITTFFHSAFPDVGRAISFNVPLVGVPIIVALLCLFLTKKSPRAGRIPLLILAVVCSSMLTFQGRMPGNLIPFLDFQPLAANMVELFNTNALFVYALIVMAVVLAVRFLFTIIPGRFNWLDRGALFVIATISAELQTSWWSNPDSHGVNIPSTIGDNGSPTAMNQQFLVSANQFLAFSLLGLVCLGLGIALVMLLVYLVRSAIDLSKKPGLSGVPAQVAQAAQSSANASGKSREEKTVRWLDRLLLFGTTLICALLEWFFGNSGMIAAGSSSFSLRGMSLNQIIAVGLAILALIALFRVTREFKRPDRFILLVDAVICLLFFFGNGFQSPPPLLPISTVIQQFIENVLQRVSPGLLFSLMLLVTAFTSLLWLNRSRLQPDRLVHLVLGVMFGIAVVGALLEPFGAVSLLMVALILLIQGGVLALQMERVR